MSRIVESLTEPQTARARMRAGGGFEAEASVTVSPAGLLAIGGLVAAILLSMVPIVRASRRRVQHVGAPEPQRLVQHGKTADEIRNAGGEIYLPAAE
jgi:hypothetical protein